MKCLISLCCATLLLVAWTSQARAHGGESMSGMDESDACVLKKGHYTVHFTAYQQQYGASEIGMLHEVGSEKVKKEFKSYCEGVPKTGKLSIAFDLFNEEMRTLPISVRIVKASEGHEDKGSSQHSHDILSLPPTVYRDGSIRLDADIPTAGQYMAIMKLESVGPGIAHKPHSASDPGDLDTVKHSHDSGDPTEAEIHAVDPTFSIPFTVGLETQSRLPSYFSNVGKDAAGVLLGVSVVIGGIIFYRYGKRKKEA
ncbi:hypothetical protein [Candidatus Methylomirabilis sp.]|uniref:hypothetical protein n=1 Tax=Candidatus Methylomirabilis sp. TaxID=2032687 RepID=UPI003C743630